MTPAPLSDARGSILTASHTGAGLLALRAWLGVSGAILARLLGVDKRTLTRWETGTGRGGRISDDARERLHGVLAWTVEVEEVTRAALHMHEPGHRRLTLYRTERDFRVHAPPSIRDHPFTGPGLLGSTWANALAGRIAMSVPDVAMEWAGDRYRPAEDRVDIRACDRSV